MDEKIKEELTTIVLALDRWEKTRFSKKKKYIMRIAWRRSKYAKVSSRCRHARRGYKGGK